ncbi:hypothetical protein DIPPA_53367 [Diplonema papillatum]|nr:hypothetical protein DIPPA_53367 [Diplonema papillatum]
MYHHATSFIIQCVISILYLALEYLQILNLYNCHRYMCGGVSCTVLGALALNAFVFRENLDLSLPVVIVHVLGGSGLLFWSIEWWNVSTRHRTEYYDTHTIFFVMLFVVNMMAIYRFLDKQSEQAQVESMIRQILVEKASEDELFNKAFPEHRLSCTMDRAMFGSGYNFSRSHMAKTWGLAREASDMSNSGHMHSATRPMAAE